MPRAHATDHRSYGIDQHETRHAYQESWHLRQFAPQSYTTTPCSRRAGIGRAGIESTAATLTSSAV